MSDDQRTMSMQFPVVCWDCEKPLSDGDVRELAQQEIVTTGTVGQPAVRIRRMVRLVCGFCYRHVRGPEPQEPEASEGYRAETGGTL